MEFALGVFVGITVALVAVVLAAIQASKSQIRKDVDDQ